MTDTLGFHSDLTKTLLGEDSKAVAFLNQKIEQSPNGREEKVIAHESQMIALLMAIHNGETDFTVSE